jgi:hypothetical protein
VGPLARSMHVAERVRWMLRGQVEGDPKYSEPGLAERLKLGWAPDREPDLKFDTATTAAALVHELMEAGC